MRAGKERTPKESKKSKKKDNKKDKAAKNNISRENGKKHKAGIVILCLLVIIGIVGGSLIKLGFLGGGQESAMMPNAEANRLISYLGINDFNYTDKLGSTFTVKNAKELIDASGVKYDKFPISVENKPGFLPVTRKQFEVIYETLIKEMELDRLSKESLYIYGVDNSDDMNVNGIAYETVHTSGGDYYMEKDYGFPREYVGSSVDLYISNNEIILCLGKSSNEVVIRNAYLSKKIEEEEKQYILVYVNSGMQKFPVEDNTDAAPNIKECLCDITLTDGGVTKITDHTNELIEARVTSYTDGLVYVEGYEEPFYLSDKFNVYKTTGAFKASQSAGTLIGYDKLSLYLKDSMIEAAILTQDIHSKKIRVLISNTDYTNYYHSEVVINSDMDYTITYGETSEEHKAGERLIFNNGSEQLKNGSARITSKEENGKITIESVGRQSGSPAYRGTIELTRNDKGVIIVNELSVEEYLYGVVPSEMPVTYAEEALKAQAICARAYAYRQMNSDTFAEYGAHLDDSISTQVYNNVPEDDRAINAVDDTYGVVPCYDGEVIEAFFFSTSCGSTSSNSSVWGGYQEPYLLDTMENEINDIANLSDEENFRSFIDGNLGTDFIEAEEPFFRWSVGYTNESLTNTINKHLYERMEAMPEYILAKNSNGSYDKKAIKTIGDLVSIQVTKRGASGIIEEMEITGTAETILVKGQTNARALLSPEDVTIRKQDGSTLKGWNTLPSAYYYVEGGNGYVIHGGGFGHGVGLSQNGANDMAKLGYYASDIIEHYYTGVELKDMYKMMGE